MKKIFLFVVALFIASEGLIAEEDMHYGWRRLLSEETYDIGMNPYNSNTLLAGGTGRRFYKSEDGGLTWNKDYVIALSGASRFNNIAISHLDTNVYIMGGISLVDLYRTDDGGKKWSIVNTEGQRAYLNGKCLYEDQKNPGRFYYASYDNGLIYESNDNGITWDSISAIELWTKVMQSDGTIVEKMVRQMPTCLGIRPDSNNIILVGNLSGSVMMSHDYGKTWDYTGRLRLPKEGVEEGSNEVTMFYFNDTDPRRVYAVITYTVVGDTPNGGLWRSDDGGYNWRSFAFPDTSFWGVACRTLPNGQEEIFVGGYNSVPASVDSMNVPGNKVVRGSFDSGQTWWTFDNEIDWSDPNPVLRRIKKYEDRYAVCGQQGVFATSGANANGFMPTDFYHKDRNINDFIFLDKYEYLIVGDGGKIYTNYGRDYGWDSIDVGYITNLQSVEKIGDNAYCAVGDDGLILTSRNNMYKWKKVDVATDKKLFTIKRTNDVIRAVGEDGLVLTSLDNAYTWESKIVCNADIYDFDFADDNNGMLVSTLGEVYCTSDGGTTWNKMELPTTDSLFGVKYLDLQNACIVGKHSLIYSTTDGGVTWNKHTTDFNQNIRAAVYSNADSIVVVGASETYAKAFPQTKSSRILSSCFGPIANIWSLRYLGEKGKEKLYMATEAGLFILDDFSAAVEDITRDDPQGNLNLVYHNDMLTIAYRRAYQNQRNPLEMRVVDIYGNVVFRKTYSGAMFENIVDNIELNNLSTGVYIVEYIEKDVKSVKKFVKE